MTQSDDVPEEGAVSPVEHRRWWIYRGTGEPLHDTRLRELLPPPPPWREFAGGPPLPPPPEEPEMKRRLGGYVSERTPSVFGQQEADMVNAALLLRRPLLVTGRPGTGKSSLAYRISHELRLGRVLRWHITSSSTLQRGLYEYDAIGRVHDAATVRAAAGEARDDPSEVAAAVPSIGDYIQLGPLGTALLPYDEPRVLLIDELDKSDLDLANDLLNVLEEGTYSIRELLRARRRHPEVRVLTDDPGVEVSIVGGQVACRAFPAIVMTSNSEREFPPAFLRRCLRLQMREPTAEDLANALAAHFGDDTAQRFAGELIEQFVDRSRERGGLSIDQLMNSVHLASSSDGVPKNEIRHLVDALWHRLDGAGIGTETA